MLHLNRPLSLGCALSACALALSACSGRSSLSRGNENSNSRPSGNQENTAEIAGKPDAIVALPDTSPAIDYEKIIKEKEAEIKLQQEKIEALKSDLYARNLDLESSKAELEKTNKIISDLNKEIHEAGTASEALKAKIEEYKAYVAVLEGNISTMEKEVELREQKIAMQITYIQKMRMECMLNLLPSENKNIAEAHGIWLRTKKIGPEGKSIALKEELIITGEHYFIIRTGLESMPDLPGQTQQQKRSEPAMKPGTSIEMGKIIISDVGMGSNSASTNVSQSVNQSDATKDMRLKLEPEMDTCHDTNGEIIAEPIESIGAIMHKKDHIMALAKIDSPMMQNDMDMNHFMAIKPDDNIDLKAKFLPENIGCWTYEASTPSQTAQTPQTSQASQSKPEAQKIPVFKHTGELNSIIPVGTQD